MLLKRIDSDSIGRYAIVTESDSRYEINISKDEKTLRRVPREAKRTLRKDNEKIKIVEKYTIMIGEPAVFVLEPLGIFGNGTVRITTRVEKIESIN
ncbi:MAG: hypothetical protein ABF683_13815 [Sporolactobacillus sp.]